MPRLSRKDIELVIELLRRRSPRNPEAQSDENRLLRRLESRVDERPDALRNWKRRGHTEMVQKAKSPKARWSKSVGRGPIMNP